MDIINNINEKVNTLYEEYKTYEKHTELIKIKAHIATVININHIDDSKVELVCYIKNEDETINNEFTATVVVSTSIYNTKTNKYELNDSMTTFINDFLTTNYDVTFKNIDDLLMKQIVVLEYKTYKDCMFRLYKTSEYKLINKLITKNQDYSKYFPNNYSTSADLVSCELDNVGIKLILAVKTKQYSTLYLNKNYLISEYYAPNKEFIKSMTLEFKVLYNMRVLTNQYFETLEEYVQYINENVTKVNITVSIRESGNIKSFLTLSLPTEL